MHDRWNVTSGFKPALRADGLHHSLDTLDLDLDLLLLLFNIKIFLLIWLSNWQLFLLFSLLVVVVVMDLDVDVAMPIQYLHLHLHHFTNMDIYLCTSSNSWPYFPQFPLLFNVVMLLYVLLFITL